MEEDKVQKLKHMTGEEFEALTPEERWDLVKDIKGEKLLEIAAFRLKQDERFLEGLLGSTRQAKDSSDTPPQ